MKQLLFASHNENKILEVREMVSGKYEILGLKDVGLTDEIPEPYKTFEANAQAKALYAFKHLGIPSFSDDSGLEVEALGNRPGVLSARYAGENKNSHENIQKVLTEIKGVENRLARFVAVFAFQRNDHQCHFFIGTVEGSICHQPMGNGGFGYDPVFMPAGFDQTFGQLNASIKKTMSHRAIAMAKFLSFLEAN